jgi:hypothetical protein
MFSFPHRSEEALTKVYDLVSSGIPVFFVPFGRLDGTLFEETWSKTLFIVMFPLSSLNLLIG